jgi:hypothetical protein
VEHKWRWERPPACHYRGPRFQGGGVAAQQRERLTPHLVQAGGCRFGGAESRVGGAHDGIGWLVCQIADEHPDPFTP